MKKYIAVLFLIGLFAYGEGTVSESNSNTRAMQRVKLSWITSTNGWASLSTSGYGGELLRIRYTSGSGVSTNLPTNLYDVTLTDGEGFDILQGTGANIGSNATVNSYGYTNNFPIAIDSASYSLVVTNAGSVRNGTIELFIR